MFQRRRAFALAAVTLVFAGTYALTRTDESTAGSAGRLPTTPSRGARFSAGGHLLITATGVTAPIVKKTDAAWVVRAPCGGMSTVTHGTELPPVQVIIDPGHGGTEPGAIANGLRESVVNLQVAHALQRALTAQGITSALTRTGDYYLPIASRAAIVNAAQPKLFISVHHNSGPFTARTTPGTEVYYQHQSAASKRLAGLVYENVFSALRRIAIPWVGADDAGAIYRLGRTGDDFYGVLRLTHVPAILVEATYLSALHEAQLLKTGAFRDVEANALAAGVREYLRTTNPGSGFRTPFPRPFTDDGGGGLTNCVNPRMG